MTYEVLELARGGRVHVRDANPEDASAFIAHRKRTCAESEFLALYPDEVSADVEKQACLIRKASSDPTRAIIVASASEDVIGFAGYMPAGPGRKAAHRVRIALSVDGPYCGQGIGSALVSALITSARASGLHQLELEVVRENVRARRLYERFGFTVFGTCPKASRTDDGVYHDEVLMALAL